MNNTFFERQRAILLEPLPTLSPFGQGKKGRARRPRKIGTPLAEALEKKIDKDADIDRKFEDRQYEHFINTDLTARSWAT